MSGILDNFQKTVNDNTGFNLPKIILFSVILVLLFLVIYLLFFHWQPKPQKNKTTELSPQTKSVVNDAYRYKLLGDAHFERNNIGESLKYYLLAADKGNIQSLFRAGQIYRFGVGNNETNKNYSKAKKIYRYIIRHGNNKQKAEARQILGEVIVEERIEILRNQRPIDPPLPPTPPPELVEEQPPAPVPQPILHVEGPIITQDDQFMQNPNDIINAVFGDDPMRNRTAVRRGNVRVENAIPADILNDFDPMLETAILNDIMNRRNPPAMNVNFVNQPILHRNLPRRFRLPLGGARIIRDNPFMAPEIIVNPPQRRPDEGDPQNVHDSGVVRSMRNAVNIIGDEEGTKTIPQSINEVKRLLTERGNNKALRALQYIERNDHVISALDKREVEVLNMVWNRINDPINTDRKNDMINILVKQLEDCNEGPTGVVCSMGRVGRVLQTLEGTDKADKVKLKPEWAIKQEIQNVTSKVYQDTLAAAPVDIKEACEVADDKATPEQKKKYEDFKQQLSSKLTEKFTKDYVDQGLMTPETVGAEVKTMVDAI